MIREYLESVKGEKAQNIEISRYQELRSSGYLDEEIVMALEHLITNGIPKNDVPGLSYMQYLKVYMKQVLNEAS